MYTRTSHALSLAVAGLLLGSIGCEDRPEAGASEDAAARPKPEAGFIAFVGAGERDPLWPVLKASAERYARDTSLFEVRYFNTHGSSPQDQVELLAGLTDPKMRGICIHIIDAKALDPGLRRLYMGGVRIVSMLEPAPADIRAGHAGFDDDAIGRALAALTADALQQQGTIMVLHAEPLHPMYGPRLRSFDEAIASCPGIKVTMRRQCAGNPREAREIIQEWCERYPRLSAWVSMADWPLRELGAGTRVVPERCKLITFGGMPSHWPLIRDGTMPGVVGADYSELGAAAVQLCEQAIRKTASSVSVYGVPVRTVRAAELDTYIRDWQTWCGALGGASHPGP